MEGIGDVLADGAEADDGCVAEKQKGGGGGGEGG